MSQYGPSENLEPFDGERTQALRVGFNRERRDIVAVALAFAFGIVVIVVTMLWGERKQSIDAAESELRNLALAHSEITARAFEGVDIVLRAAAEAASAGDFADPAFAQRLHLSLRERVVGSQVLQALAVFDANGRMVAQSRLHPVPAIRIDDRDHFIAARDRAPGTSVVGQPAFNRTTNEWSLFVAWRLTRDDGAFAGVATVTVDPLYFERIYGAINRGRPDSSIEMFRDDGTLLVRHLSMPLAQAYSAGDPVLREYLAGSTEIKVLRGRVGIDDEPRVIAARFIAGFPVYLAVSERESTALREWRNNALVYAGATGATLAALAVLLFMLLRQVSAREAAFRASGARASRRRCSAPSSRTCRSA